MTRPDRMETVSTEALRTVRMGGFELSAEYKHLSDAPLVEFETCDTDALTSINLGNGEQPVETSQPANSNVQFPLGAMPSGMDGHAGNPIKQ